MHNSQQGRWTRNRYRYVALLHSHKNSIQTQNSPMSTVQDPLDSPFIINNAAGGKPTTARVMFEANSTARGKKFIPEHAFRGREDRHIGINIRAPSCAVAKFMIDMSPSPMEMEVIIVAFRSFHSTPAEYGEPDMI